MSCATVSTQLLTNSKTMFDTNRNITLFPKVRIAMNSVGAIKAMDQDEQQLQTVISDILTTALRDTIYPVDFSIYSTCPRAEVEPLDLPVIYPVHYDSLAVSVGSSEKMPALVFVAVLCLLFFVLLCPGTLVIAHRTRLETICTVLSSKQNKQTLLIAPVLHCVYGIRLSIFNFQLIARVSVENSFCYPL